MRFLEKGAKTTVQTGVYAIRRRAVIGLWDMPRAKELSRMRLVITLEATSSLRFAKELMQLE